MAKLISPEAIVSSKANLEHPVRVFAFAGIQKGAEIGRYTYINRYAFVSGHARMGRYCSISRAVEIGAMEHPLNMLSTHPFQYSKLHFEDNPGYTDFDRDFVLEPLKTHLGHDVMVGAKGIIKGGVTVGTGAVIGANSFVNTDVPPYAIVTGSPATIIRYRFDAPTIEKLLASDWWNLTPAEMAGMSFDNIDMVLEQIAEALARKKTAVAESAAPPQTYEDDHMVVGLRHSLIEMDMHDEVIDLVLKNAAAVAKTFDPLDPSDQEILRNKLTYLADFLSERDVKGLSSNERKHIANLFSQKL